jgi:class 3 adenylate cyclase
MATVHVRYLVDDVAAAVAFYTTHLGFTLLTDQGPAFADVQRGDLRLLLAGPQSSAARPMPDGTQPRPGGWNRIHLIVDDIEAEVTRLRAAGLPFRNDIVRGPGGAQILIDDPSGNPIELFQPRGPRSSAMPDTTAPVRREVGVLIVDLSGFTPFVETAEPERTFATLGEYHAALTPIVARNEGIVMDMVGDSVCVTFQASPGGTDPVLRTVQAAFDLQAALGRLVAEWRRRGDNLGFAIGVSYGFATLGFVRIGEHSEYRAMGATVLVASRLAGAAKGERILATERLTNAAATLASGTLIADVELAGLRRPPRVFELVAREV